MRQMPVFTEDPQNLTESEHDGLVDAVTSLEAITDLSSDAGVELLGFVDRLVFGSMALSKLWLEDAMQTIPSLE